MILLKLLLIQMEVALSTLNYLPQELCDIAVHKYQYSIKYVPPMYQTEELCLLAVKRQGLYLKYIHNQTADIVKAALNHNAKALVFVKSQTIDMIKNLLENNKTDTIMMNVNYSLLVNKSDEQKLFTKDQITNIVLELSCSEDIKSEILKKILW